MSSSEDTLRVVVKIGSQENILHLGPGTRLRLGRSSSCAIPISVANVSNEHLEFFWDGREFFVSDLNSSNGTFRLPQKSPFLKSSFSSHSPEGLQLNLAGTVELHLTWSLVQFSAANDKTEVMGNVKTHVGSSTPNSNLPYSTSVQTTLKTLNKTQPYMNTSYGTEASQRFVQMLYAWVAFLVSLSVGTEFFGGAFRMDSMDRLRGGGAYDLVILWMEYLSFYSGKAFLCAVIFVLGWVYLGRKTAQMNSSFFLGCRSFFGQRRLAWKELCALFGGLGALSVFFWPFLLSLFLGVAPFDFLHLNEIRSLYRETRSFEKMMSESLESLEKRSNDIHLYMARYRGSSFLYLTQLKNQEARILKKCDGRGQKPWENKKSCLVLLALSSTEIFQQIQPLFLQEVAARVALLNSLDALIRIVNVDGIEDKTIDLLLQNLALSGLKDDSIEIANILQSNEFSLSDKNALLQQARIRVELRLEARLRSMHLPRSLWLYNPSPLELGV